MIDFCYCAYIYYFVVLISLKRLMSYFANLINMKINKYIAPLQITTNTQFFLQMSIQMYNNVNNVLKQPVIFETLWRPMNSAEEIFVDGDFKHD